MQIERLSNKQTSLMCVWNAMSFPNELLFFKLLFIKYVCNLSKYKDLVKALENAQTIKNYLDISNIILNNVICEPKETNFSHLCEDTLEISKSVGVTYGLLKKFELKIIEFVNSVDPQTIPDYLKYRFKYILETNHFTKEFATPDSIVDLSIKLLNINAGDTVADFCCGYGNFLSRACDHCLSLRYKNNKFIGYDISYDAICLSKINLILRGAESYIFHEDVLNDKFIKYKKIFSEFPIGGVYNKTTKELGAENWEPIHIDKVSRSSFSWVYMAKAINSLEQGGTAVCVAPLGALFSTYESTIRQQVIEGNFLDTVITLPKLHIPYLGISTCILVFKKNHNNFVYFIDGSKLGKEEKRKCVLSQEAINKLYDLYSRKQNTDISRKVDKRLIEEADYNLVPGRYVFKSSLSNIKIPYPKKLEYITTEIVKSYISDSRELTSDNKTNIKVVKSSDLENGSINFNTLSYLKEKPQDINKYLLKDGDILLTNKSTKIKTAIVRLQKNEKIVMFGSLYGIRVNNNLANPNYIQCFLNSSVGNLKLSQIQTGTIIQCITLNNLFSLEIPCPPLSEQNKVAKEYQLKLEMLEDTKQRAVKLAKDINEMFSKSIEE